MKLNHLNLADVGDLRVPLFDSISAMQDPRRIQPVKLPNNTLWHLTHSSNMLKLADKLIIFDYPLAASEIKVGMGISKKLSIFVMSYRKSTARPQSISPFKCAILDWKARTQAV